MTVAQLFKEEKTLELINRYKEMLKNPNLEETLLAQYLRAEESGREVTYETLQKDLYAARRFWDDEDPATHHTTRTTSTHFHTPTVEAFDLSQINTGLTSEASDGVSRTIALRLGSLQYPNPTLQVCPYVQAVPNGLEIRYTEQNKTSAIKLLKALRRVENLHMENNLGTGSRTHPHCVFILKADLPVFLKSVGFLPQNIEQSITDMYQNLASNNLSPPSSQTTTNSCVTM